MGNEGVLCRIILKSSWLRDAISEIDPSCEKLTFIATPPNDTRRRTGDTPPRLRIQADGAFGTTEIDYPNDKEVLETFDCAQKFAFSYRYSHIIKTLRALSSSTKTSMRVNEEGLLAMQFLMPKPGSNSIVPDGFVEFRCLALDE
ncbi:hypothetical protein NMY22_g17042 [Coprinellus aureogranulatus]|nr:hypothetical protein NMY22_g17042 [Coprinellus aureogranulatus]